MLPVGFEPVIPASERPQTHALYRGGHQMYHYPFKIIKSLVVTIRTPRCNAKYSDFLHPAFVLFIIVMVGIIYFPIPHSSIVGPVAQSV
jgi:hypothetical protein